MLVCESADVNKDLLPFERVEIEAFRGLRGVTLPALGRVNLLIGSGNSGKTSLLEAMKVFSAPLSLREWITAGRLREARGNVLYPTQAVDVLRWMFPHEDSAVPDKHSPLVIGASGRCDIKRLVATCERISALSPQPIAGPTSPTDLDFDDEEVSTGFAAQDDEGWRVQIAASFADDRSQKVDFIAWDHAQSTLPVDGVTIPSQLLAPYAHRNQPAQLRALTNTIIQDGKSEIEDLIRDLDPNVLGIEIVTDESGEKPVLALRHRHAGVAPINVFGDGTRRALMIAVAMRQVRDGILMLDEIEAALHVSALDKLFGWLEHACVYYNVQVFASTHSLEAIDAIASCSQGDLAAYHIAGPSGAAKRYSNSMLQRLVHERGLDIRQ
jgi:hypothetical protein